MLTSSQLRAARALINMTIEDVSAASGLTVDAINAAERSSGYPAAECGERLRRLFEARGVIFVGSGQQDSSGPGVRLHQTSADEGLRPQHLNSANDG